jgi:hypothetical protein
MLAHRYGDELHLDEALDKIFKFGKGGLSKRLCPKLKGGRAFVSSVLSRLSTSKNVCISAT